MDKIKIKEMLFNDIQESLKNALTIHNVEIKIKNLNEVLDIVSVILEEIRNVERIEYVLHYINASFNILISLHNLYVMNYFYEVYDEGFFSGLENNTENISESHMNFFVSIFPFDIKKRLGISKTEFDEKVQLIEEIFARNSVNVNKKMLYLDDNNVLDGFEFIYPLDAEVFWFLV